MQYAIVQFEEINTTTTTQLILLYVCATGKHGKCIKDVIRIVNAVQSISGVFWLLFSRYTHNGILIYTPWYIQNIKLPINNQDQCNYVQCSAFPVSCEG